MRVAMFSDCYHPIVNGVTTSIELQVSTLQEAGHEVRLFAPGVPGHTDVEGWVRRFASCTFPLHREERVSLPWPAANFLEVLRFAPDVVHLHTPFNVGLFGWLAAAGLGCPRVFTHHTLFEEYLHYVPLPPAWLRPVAVGLCRWFWNTSAVVVAPSHEVAERQRRQGLRRPLQVIPTGVDVASFRAGDAAGPRRELGLSGQERVLLYMGRVAREKCLDFLLEAVARARREDPRLRLVVIGDGPERPALQAQADRLGLNGHVTFLGYRPRACLRHYLAAATAFVFTSRTETQGLVLLEAQAAGVPVLAVRASGTSEAVVPERSGFLVDPGDLEAFVAALLRLVGDEALRQRLSVGALEQADRFSVGTMAGRMMAVYQQALGVGSGRTDRSGDEPDAV